MSADTDKLAVTASGRAADNATLNFNPLAPKSIMSDGQIKRKAKIAFTTNGKEVFASKRVEENEFFITTKLLPKNIRYILVKLSKI